VPIHDSYARQTPYELLLPEKGFDDENFPLIEEEAQERKADLSDLERFPLLSQAGAVLRTVRGEEDDPRLIQQYGVLLFHAFHFWKAQKPLFLLETPSVRYLVDTGPEGNDEWAPSLPCSAGYLQLPQHLFWVPGSGPDGVAESVDGLFWSAPGGENLSLLLAMGIRKDRPGLSVVPLPTLPLATAGPWVSMKVREDGPDFSSSLPGSELEQLYALHAGAEALKLAMRVFWYLDTFAGSVAQGEPGPESSEPSAGSRPEQGEDEGRPAGVPKPSLLPYRRIVLRPAE